MLKELLIGIVLAAIPTGLYLRERHKARRRIARLERRIQELTDSEHWMLASLASERMETAKHRSMSEMRQKRIVALEMHVKHLLGHHVRIVYDAIPWSER